MLLRWAFASVSPRQIPDIFEFTSQWNLPDLAGLLQRGNALQLRESGGIYSRQETHAVMKTLASRLKKQLLWIPLNTF